jgi:hypothetical protein
MLTLLTEIIWKKGGKLQFTAGREERSDVYAEALCLWLGKAGDLWVASAPALFECDPNESAYTLVNSAPKKKICAE